MRIQIRILLSIGTSLLISAAILLAVFLVLQGMAAETARSRAFGEIKNKIENLNLSIARFPINPIRAASARSRTCKGLWRNIFRP
jgi:hypothetical protein